MPQNCHFLSTDKSYQEIFSPFCARVFGGDVCVWHVQGDLQGLPPQYKITPRMINTAATPLFPF